MGNNNIKLKSPRDEKTREIREGLLLEQNPTIPSKVFQKSWATFPEVEKVELQLKNPDDVNEFEKLANKASFSTMASGKVKGLAKNYFFAQKVKYIIPGTPEYNLYVRIHLVSQR